MLRPHRRRTPDGGEIEELKLIANLKVENVTYLREGGPRLVTVCDRGGVKFVKVACTYVMDNF